MPNQGMTVKPDLSLSAESHQLVDLEKIELPLGGVYVVGLHHHFGRKAVKVHERGSPILLLGLELFSIYGHTYRKRGRGGKGLNFAIGRHKCREQQ